MIVIQELMVGGCYWQGLFPYVSLYKHNSINVFYKGVCKEVLCLAEDLQIGRTAI